MILFIQTMKYYERMRFFKKKKPKKLEEKGRGSRDLSTSLD